MSRGYITGTWANTTLLCGNEAHALTALVLERVGKRLVYRCPIEGCSFEVSAFDFEKILEKISKKIIETEEADEVFHLKGYRFRHDRFQIRVLEQTENGLSLQVTELYNRG